MADYKKLFNVDITHTFYTDGISRDFDIVPLPGTVTLMKNNRLLLKNENKGFRVMYRSEPGSSNPFVPFGPFDLRFAMILKNKNGFLNFTRLNDPTPPPPNDFEAGNLVYFKNASQLTTPLEYSLIDALKPASFTYKFPQTGGVPADNGVINILDEAGNDVTPTYPNPLAVKADSNGDFYYPVDFTLLPPGAYTFTTTVNAGTPVVKIIYIDTDLARQSAFGVIKIKVVDFDDFPGGRRYTANFVRRQTIWRYKMVLKTTEILITDSLDIVDAEAGGPFYAFERKANESTLKPNDTAVFDSIEPLPNPPNPIAIPFTELPRKRFNFVKNPGATIIMKDLANPPPYLVSSQGNNFNKSVIYITV